jgi:hypothetical protein
MTPLLRAQSLESQIPRNKCDIVKLPAQPAKHPEQIVRIEIISRVRVRGVATEISPGGGCECS